MTLYSKPKTKQKLQKLQQNMSIGYFPCSNLSCDDGQVAVLVGIGLAVHR